MLRKIQDCIEIMKTSRKNRISLTISMKLQVVSTFKKFKLWKFLLTKIKLLLGWSTFHVQNLSESFLSAGTNSLLLSVWCFLINDSFHKFETQRLALYPILSNLLFYYGYHYLSGVEMGRVGGMNTHIALKFLNVSIDSLLVWIDQLSMLNHGFALSSSSFLML